LTETSRQNFRAFFPVITMPAKSNSYQIENMLQSLKKSLLKADAKIEEIVQFGSSVYAPSLARDIDLMVVTQNKKPDDFYWDAVADCPMAVDVFVLEPGERIGNTLAWGIGGAGRLIYGDGEIIRRKVEEVPVPTYDDARQALLNADDYLTIARNTTEQARRDMHYRTAFNTLFAAARLAAMTYLNTEETRWGGLRRNLPPNFAKRFRRIIDTLHIQYFYDGEYPIGNEEAVFSGWRRVVERFINDLESASSST